MICPRSAILHRAAASRVEPSLVETVSTAERIAHLGLRDAERSDEVDGVLHDVALLLQARRDVDGGIRQESGLG